MCPFQMAYLLFILCFIYTVLDRPKPVIQWPEYLVMSYILTCALEKIRLVGIVSLLLPVIA